MDDYPTRMYSRGPGWVGIVFVSLFVSCLVVAGFYGALLRGWVPAPLPGVGPASAVVNARSLVKVPSLVGLPVAVAGELLEGRGLRLVVQDRKTDEVMAADAVLAQQPLAESSLAADTAVTVTVSMGKPTQVKVPDVTGRSLSDARQVLEAAGFVLGPVSGPDAGLVKSMEPAAGEVASRGFAVGLGLELAGVDVPKVVGLSWARAKATLEQAGFKVGKVRERYDEEHDVWVVLEQSAEPGSKLPAGASIDLVRNEGY